MTSTRFVCWLALLVFATIQSEIEAKNSGKQEESARELIHTCREQASNSSPITLAQFYEFYQHFKQVDECLHSIKEPAQVCQDAELACDRANLTYQDVRPLGALVERYKSTELVCTMEFAAKIYRIHKRLEQAETGEDEQQQPLKRVLRILGNRVASGCRKSLAKRLLEMEQRTTEKGSGLSENVKHLNAILSCLNVGPERLERVEFEPEQVNPLFTDDLVVATRAISLGRDGFETKLTEAMQTYLDVIRSSCSSLRIYQMNMLGSLGALASVGYGMSRETAVAGLNESRLDKARVHTWSLAAVLCQSVKTVIKLSREKLDGKLFRKAKVLIAQEADFSLPEEDDTVFATYRLDEEQNDRDLNETDPKRDLYKFDSAQTNRHKKQLLQGPNYRMVRAILAYINPMQQEDRFKIPYEMLGIEPPKDQANATDAEEEEEEEEEEE